MRVGDVHARSEATGGSGALKSEVGLFDGRQDARSVNLSR